MKNSKVLSSLFFSLMLSCSGGSGVTSSNATMQKILSDLNTIQNNCPNFPAPQKAQLKAPTQDQVNKVVAACSAADLTQLQTFTGCVVSAICSGSSINQAALTACVVPNVSAACTQVNQTGATTGVDFVNSDVLKGSSGY